MSHITLIRHGQANTQARDEKEYDKLSELGQTQASWLGAHLRETHSHHTRIYSGTLTRHIETAAAMGHTTEVIQDPRLNEMQYFDLAQALEAEQGIPVPQEREQFIKHLPITFAAWQAGEIKNVPESWEDFEARSRAVIMNIASGEGPAMVVTSGGFISMVLRQSMGLDTIGMARLALSIMNTSMHRLFPIGDHLSPVMFNAVPHLEDPERHFAQTHL